MTTKPTIYVREDQGTWHILWEGSSDLSLCYRAPFVRWDDRTTERPAILCKFCRETAPEHPGQEPSDVA